mmetsp:Transcript_14505/g.27865  ORF Transcript_14505/g.27865 Transcript_14505/m.27865 type:complete len:358 (+) Transcript_14505:40-1113(+)
MKKAQVSMPPPPPRRRAPNDEGCPNPESFVRGTNDDATLSKLSCEQKGYLKDDFVRHFVRRPQRRAPIINRGYFSRVLAVHTLLDQFLEAKFDGPERQVVSLGCGFDTTFFKLKVQGRAPTRYIEVDYHEVTAKKTAIIASKEPLWSVLDDDANSVKPHGVAVEIVTQNYSLVAADLRQPEQLERALAKAHFDASVPTFFLAECVLVYLEPPHSHALLQHCSKACAAPSVFVLYEQICPDDAFGRQMLINLESRGIALPGIHAHPDLVTQRQRYLDAGWERAEALDMYTIHHKCLDSATVRRADQLEIFDEFEEWQLIQSHYCVAYGMQKDPAGILGSFGFKIEQSEPSVGLVLDAD